MRGATGYFIFWGSGLRLKRSDGAPNPLSGCSAFSDHEITPSFTLF